MQSYNSKPLVHSCRTSFGECTTLDQLEQNCGLVCTWPLKKTCKLWFWGLTCCLRWIFFPSRKQMDLDPINLSRMGPWLYFWSGHSQPEESSSSLILKLRLSCSAQSIWRSDLLRKPNLFEDHIRWQSDCRPSRLRLESRTLWEQLHLCCQYCSD